MSTNDEQPNPLLKAFAPFIPVCEMPRRLRREPLSNVPWREMSPNAREQFLELQTEHFFATTAATDIATRVHAAILGGIRRRNPLSIAEQKRINQLALLQASDLDILPSLANPATAGIIAATTGMGKTSIIERTLQVIAPEQVVVHARSEACGWSKLVQICYLKLDFPSNGSRGGLIDHTLAGIDNLIGTDYARHVRRRNLEAGLIEVMKQLSSHRVGVLVLDEIQPGTFGMSQWYREFVMFLLCLMNLGIPLILCGQPGAFTHLVSEMQTLRRFSGIGLFELQRAVPDADAWWVDEFIPGMFEFNLCENLQNVTEIIKLSRQASAGIPGFFSRLWVEAQRLAIREEGDIATLTPRHLVEATSSEAIATLMRTASNIESEAQKAAEQLRNQECAATNPSATDDTTKRGYRAADNNPSAVKKLVHTTRIEEKRRKKKEEKQAARNAAYSKGLPAEDLRIANQALALLEGLDQVQAELAIDGSPSDPGTNDAFVRRKV